MKLKKLTAEEFETKIDNDEACTEPTKKPTVNVYRGDVPVKLNFKDYDLPIPAGTYNWLVFVPCELIGEHNWVRGFMSNYVVGLKNGAIAVDGPRKPRTKLPKNINIIELENNGVLFAVI